MQHIKYQRTYHLPGSPGVSNDDKVLTNIDHFIKKDVIITEKMDGENTTMYRNGIHARSLSSNNHPSRSWVKSLHADISYMIPDDMRICGENLYAVHSIYYDKLPSYFLVFGIYKGDVCLPWHATEQICKEMGLKTVPVLYNSYLDSKEDIIKTMTGLNMPNNPSVYGSQREGCVIRLASAFNQEETQNIAKWVRKGHVQTDIHWMNSEIRLNGLAC